MASLDTTKSAMHEVVPSFPALQEQKINRMLFSTTADSDTETTGIESNKGERKALVDEIANYPMIQWFLRIVGAATRENKYHQYQFSTVISILAFSCVGNLAYLIVIMLSISSSCSHEDCLLIGVSFLVTLITVVRLFIFIPTVYYIRRRLNAGVTLKAGNFSTHLCLCPYLMYVCLCMHEYNTIHT